MQRYIVVPIVIILLLAGCARAPVPTPTAAPPTELPAPTAAAPSPTFTVAKLAQATLPSATATQTPVPPTTTRTNTPAPTLTPTASPAPTASSTPVPTRRPIAPIPTITTAPTSAPAPAPTSVPPAGAAWHGEYFPNPDLNGNPVLVRTDADLNFDWGLGSPDPKVPTDHFSARWTRSVTLAAGRWRFHAMTDDGVRVYVDGVPVIDRWQTTASVTYNTSARLSGGNHNLRVEYYDNIEQARIHVWWEPDDGSATDPAHAGAWRGDYFSTRDLSGSVVFSRDDPAVYFDWGEGGPGGGIAGQNFSVRWTREAFIPGGHYIIRVKPDDGVRVWLDWASVIDQWHDSAGDTTYSQEINVSNAIHTLVVEYYQGAGPAAVRFTMEPTNANWIGNLYTCVGLDRSWVKVYRLAPNDQWEDMNPNGYGPNTADGQLTLFGVPIDATFGWDGQPYRVELWVHDTLARSEGNIFAGQPELRVMPGSDVHTSWPCGANLPTTP